MIKRKSDHNSSIINSGAEIEIFNETLSTETKNETEMIYLDRPDQTRSDLPIKMITLNLIVQKLFIISLPSYYWFSTNN